jgi:hypothetical protein
MFLEQFIWVKNEVDDLKFHDFPWAYGKGWHMAYGVWQGMAMDSLKYHYGPSCLAFLCPADGPLLKRPYSRFRGGSSARVWPAAV